MRIALTRATPNRNPQCNVRKGQNQGRAQTVAASPQRTATGAAPVTGIAGVYTGYYICAQGYTRLKLAILPESNGALSAVFAFQPPNGAPGGVKETAFALKGQYTAQTGQFKLTPDRWVTAAPIGYQMVGVEGSYEQSSDSLKASIPARGCTTVEVKRDAALSSQLQSQVTTTQKQTDNLPPGAIADGRFPETCLAFQAWTSRVAAEYPGQDMYRTQLQLVFSKILNLFEDQYFTKYFGKNFDQLSQPERMKLGTQVIRQCFTTPQFSSAITWERQLDGPFISPTGYARAMATVMERRKLRQELQQVLSQAKSLPAQATAWEQALALESGAKRFDVLWPSETKDLGGAIADAKKRAATPALQGEVQSVLASARGFEGLQNLEQLPTRQAVLFAAADSSVAASLRQQISAKSSEILDGLLSAERAEMLKIPGGIAGLKQGVAWYQGFESRFAQRPERPIQELTRSFFEKRTQVLAAAQPELTRMIQQAKTESEVDSIFRTYVPLQGDQQSPLVATLKQIGAARTDALERAAVLGNGAAPARQTATTALPASPQRQTTTAPALGDPAKREPTREEMYDALKVLIDNYNANMKSTESSCRSGDFRNDPVMAMQCLFVMGGSGGRGGIEAKITSFNKIACEKSARPGWICDFRAGMSVSGATIPASLRAMMGAGEVGQKRFVWNGEHWLALDATETVRVVR